MPWIVQIVKRPPVAASASGKSLYQSNCAQCHKADRTGAPPDFPSLVGVDQHYTDTEIAQIIHGGNGRMPAFNNLNEEELGAIVNYVLSGKDDLVASTTNAQAPAYRLAGYTEFLDSEGYPAITPPWGQLSAIDLNRGTIVWQVPFGEYPELTAKGVAITGSENYGGGIVTAGGLFFIGATNYDRKFHAFDKTTGKLLWETTLPAAGNATPAIYEAYGRQFVVIAAGRRKISQGSVRGKLCCIHIAGKVPVDRHSVGANSGSFNSRTSRSARL